MASGLGAINLGMQPLDSLLKLAKLGILGGGHAGEERKSATKLEKRRQIQSTMATSSSSKDKFFNNVINPYMPEVMQHPQAIHMCDGVLHICDVQGPKATRSMEARFEAMEQEVFRCNGMVERGLNANHLMIADYTRDLKVDGKSMKDIIFSLNEQINFLHSQIHDLRRKVFEYEARFKVKLD
ncbi:40S ribosomal protein S5-1 [Hordeum vulgare]|nr:40S ribosomal protein S5-1 [Hordeum vulgare]